MPDFPKDSEMPALTSAEWQVFQDREFMPLKQSVWKKLETQLNVLSREAPDTFRVEGLEGSPIWKASAKISRGENYNSYSYRCWDFPRYFHQEDMFLFRLMLLWGHPIGIHLILSGSFKKEIEKKLLTSPLSTDWFLSRQESPWIWEKVEKDILKLNAGEAEIEACLREREFLKLSRFFDLQESYRLSSLCREAWEELSSLL